ncbi:hypothetical protein [Clostridium perfringens]|uniref:YobI family P-loop NTPase n=1 Tax=Clostridium perfringens TaxID=1502 RepID=UPI001ABBAE84|nr:hypothetical protein [Clostridium perfringens]MBO3408362.1 hypothetical protein [Clostridium perfringens]
MNKIKTFVIDILKIVIRKLDVFIQVEENKNPEIEVLSPIKSLEKEDEYLSLLEKSIRHTEVYNICISGDYGSGKSSIIESFKFKFPNFKCLNISLANFSNESLNGDESLLEKAIVKQLFYKTNHKKIPSSRFTKIRDISFKKVLFSSLIILLGFSPIIVFNFNYLNSILIDKFNELNKLIPFEKNNIILLFTLLCIVSLFIFSYFISKIFNKISFMAGIKKENVELSFQVKDEKVNAFDKYIDELIYFFKRNNYDVVFFEDLDRFNNIEIFSNLRDLNRLLNDSEEVFCNKKYKRKIKFVYAIKDSIFFSNDLDKNSSSKEYNLDLSLSENRTKFFDYIIPVIPHMDSNNSYSTLQELFNKYNLEIPSEFLDDITIFITDKRLLTNTFNEFLLYQKKLTHLKIKEYLFLFSIILYKNLYPVDFLNLTKGDGLLYEIIANKKIYIKNESKKLDEKIKEVEEKIGNLNNTITKDEEDLLHLILGYLSRNGYTSISSKYFYEISLEDIKPLLNSNELIYTNKGTRYIDNIFSVDFKEDLLIKLNLIDNNEFSEKNKLKKELSELKSKRKNIFEKTLADLVKDSIIEINFDKNNLIKVLLMKGYINESYNDYISYFREGEINLREREFIQCIKSNIAIDSNYELINIDKIIAKLDIKELETKYILNIYLIKYWLENNDKIDTYKHIKILEHFKEINEFELDFLEKFSEFDISTYEILLKKISINNKNLFKELCFNNKSDDFINLNFESFINQFTVDEIIEQNINSVVNEYILNEENILNLSSIQNNKNKFIDLIQKLDIKFKSLNFETSKTEETSIKEINSIINKQNLYDINRSMIDYIYNLNNKIQLFESNISYSMIKDSNNKYMQKYISDNINTYIKNVFLKENFNLSPSIINDKYPDEKIEYIIELLNLVDLNEDLLEEIIKKREFIIDDFTEITNKKAIDILLFNNRISINWDNLIFYFNNNGLDNYLIDCLNSKTNIKKLKNQSISEETITNCFDLKYKILLEERISNESIKSLKNLFHTPIEDINLSNISEERLKNLIELDILSLTPQIYDNIAEKKESILLVEKNIEQFIIDKKNYKYILFDSEVKYILESKNISIEQKLRFLSILNDKELNLAENYKFIGEFVLKKNIPELFELEEEIIKLYFEELKENANTMSLSEIKLTLSKLKVQYEGFNILKSGSFKINIDDNLDKDFLDILKIKGVISSFTFLNDDEVKINRKQNKKLN